ncbi:tRNA lysidine(34) synthetase TilS [Francisella philomiragia]|uniref:tRNA lysidine(34) synthetase TilS n=1 Tax=Francisella philomiragia TaxID=28110 RepID=UPI001C9D7A92|nr:tRNA lysidine(34) synthetase TilS [Francisella philomiragia]MBY7733886.1 tRNA lysidine(34) synthetase TilS [Francisella philomiragia]
MSLDKTQIISQILKRSPSHIIIGYSGGVDSSVLLDITKDLDIPTIAIYINHNIHPDALKWQLHCQTKCNNTNIKFIAHSLDQAPKGESFEAWASKQRMVFFIKIMSQYSNPILLLGHHLDDQAETFLIQAIRGSGLAGLASMPYYKQLNHGAVLRPLLDYTKEDIQQFAKQHNIDYIYDDSNEDIKYRRNLIRNQIMPILKQVNPNISKTLSRSAKICAESNNILQKLLNEKLEKISKENSLIISELLTLDNDIQKSLIHHWFKETTNQSLKSKQIEEIHKTLNSYIHTGWLLDINQQYQISVEYNHLIIKNNNLIDLSSDDKDIIEWLKKKWNKGFNAKEIIVRERQTTDKCRYQGRNKANKLKVLFQELKIPASERSKARVILLNDKIIAVYPFFICN